MTLWNVLLVGAGGCIGSIARYMMVASVDKKFNTLFPYGTLAVNIVGSFIFGLLLAWLSLRGDTAMLRWRLFLGVGFCGGFTTFSAFAGENLHLLTDRFYGTGLTYVLVSVFGGLFAVWAGFAIARAIM